MQVMDPTGRPAAAAGAARSGQGELEDAALVARARREPERPALQALYLRYEREVFRFLLRLTSDRDLAEDALQETFVLVQRGLHRYDADRPFQDRSQGEERGWSFANGPGADEEIVFVAPQPMTVTLVVHKSGSADLLASGSYRLEVGTNTTDGAPAAGPAATRLAAPYPNPFRADAAVRFDLARAGGVRLEVYDLRGARVRTLAEGRWEAGRHSVPWDGRDDGGRPVSPGIYLVRMQAEGYDGRTKVVRMR